MSTETSLAAGQHWALASSVEDGGDVRAWTQDS